MIRFGTGGWRAVIAEEFTFPNVRRVAKALALQIKDGGAPIQPVIVGHDLRFLSGRFSRAFAEILVDEQVPVWFMEDPVPTPMLMYGVEQEGLDYGIMLTASHNPPEYNGIKVIVKDGRDAPLDVTERLEGYLDQVPAVVTPKTDFFTAVEKGSIQYFSNKNAYIDSLLDQVDVAAIQRIDMKILFNPMFGVAKDIMAMCLASLRCFVDIINNRRDTMFGLKMPSPERESLQDMEVIMKERRYHLGLATDGDSDRLALYDELGNYVGANQILKLLFFYFKEYRKLPGGIVRNLTTTHVLDRMAEHYGEQCYEVPVGFKYISETMDTHDLLLGGESSGGLKIRGHVNGKDGILAALLVVEMLATTGKTLGQLLEEIDRRFGVSDFYAVNLPFSPSRRDALYRILLQEKYVPAFGKEAAKVSYMDGVKYYFTDDSWLSIRFSGTEPVLRVFMEMKQREEALQMADVVLQDPRLGLQESPQDA